MDAVKGLFVMDFPMPLTHNKTGRSKKSPAFVQIFHAMIKTTAWLHLTPQARAVYIELKARYNGGNNGKFSLSNREIVERCKMASATASRALQELEDFGFIEAVEKGRFTRKQRHASTWRLTEYFCNETHQPASRKYVHFKYVHMQFCHPYRTAAVLIFSFNIQ